MRETSPHFLTPPYVTSKPEVTHRRLSLPSNTNNVKSTLRFVVLATDGLWDELSSEDVVSLVGGHLSGLRNPSISKTELQTLVPLTTGSKTVEGKDTTRRKEGKGSWAFVDDNVSTHLIRNAFGGGDNLSLRQRLSIPAPYARSFRDDLTVTVVWFDDQEQIGGSFKAKL